jgi:hypothetical protein
LRIESVLELSGKLHLHGGAIPYQLADAILPDPVLRRDAAAVGRNNVVHDAIDGISVMTVLDKNIVVDVPIPQMSEGVHSGSGHFTSERFADID